MKKLYSTMFVLCMTGLIILSNGIALGVVDTTYNVTNTTKTPNVTATMTETPIGTSQPVVTTVEPIDTTVEPVVTTTEIKPRITPKTPGFEIVLTIGVLSAIYMFRKRR